MKKILSIISLGVFALYSISFAYTAIEVKAKAESTYDTLNTNLISTYNKYVSKYNTIKENIATGDYVYLSELTGLNITGLKASIDTNYTNLSAEIVNKKYDIIAEVEDKKNKFDAGIINTGDYENSLENILAEISGYNSTYTSKINILDTNLSGLIADYNTSLEEKLNYYKAEIEKIKNVDKKVIELKDLYKNIETKKQKLEDIVGISNNIVKEKSQEIKDYVNNYFSGYVEKEYEKYVKQDPNFVYFSGQKETKKELTLGYISDKISNTIKNVVNSYFPEIDFTKLEEKLNSFKELNLEEKTSKYTEILENIDGYKTELSGALSELDKYLSKFGDNPQNDDILKILKQDIVKSLEDATKIVQNDIEQTFKSYMDFIKTKEKNEQGLVNIVSKIYEEKINSQNIDDIKNLLNTLKSYEDIIVLPTNKEFLASLQDIANKKLLELENKEILNQISKISNEIDALPIGNNYDIINQIKTKIDALKVPEQFALQIKLLQMKLQMKENLFKLFDSGAIKYYYSIGDLSNKVNQLLKGYYKKYKEQGKESKFMDKLNRALDKLAVIEDNLDNSKRSYYIVIIHNGIIKFKMDLLKNDQ